MYILLARIESLKSPLCTDKLTRTHNCLKTVVSVSVYFLLFSEHWVNPRIYVISVISVLDGTTDHKQTTRTIKL